MMTQETSTTMFVVSRPERGALGQLGLVRHFAILERCSNMPDRIHERYQGCTGVQCRQANSDEQWRIEESVIDLDAAIQRLGAAQQWGAYSTLFNNCEHMARYIATGEKQSYQVHAGVAIAVAATVMIAVVYRKQKLSAIPSIAYTH